MCPGTSSWNTLIGRLPNARGNLLDAAEVGLARGAAGYLITDWGDNGHLQPPSVSFPPLAYGAARQLVPGGEPRAPAGGALDAFVFEDDARVLGGALESLGGLYTGTGKVGLNGSPLFTELLQGGLLGSLGTPDAAGTRRVIETLDARSRRSRGPARAVQTAPWSCGSCSRPRGSRATGPFASRARRASPWPTDPELRRDLGDAIAEQRACWALRARPGGLADSVARLEATLASYPA